MITKRNACVALVALLMASTSHAQSLRNADIPAEIPPASYAGKQYVDSKGCVYIRAGIDGNVTWVPRVNRSRIHVCGQTPSLGDTRVATAPQPAPSVPVIELAPEPEIPVVAPAPAPAKKPAAAPKPRVVAKAKPKPKAVVRAPAPKVHKPVVVAAPVHAVPAPEVLAQAAAGACQGASVISTRYINSTRKLAVRCGPQAGGHGAVLSHGIQAAPVQHHAHATHAPKHKLSYGSAVPAPSANIKAPNEIGIASKRRAAAHGLQPATNVHPHALVAPKHVYAENVAEQQHTLHTPHGYRPAWKDDRLNQRRAYGTLAGKEQMDLVWTRTVPRRLIDRKSNRDVSAMFPTLYYPFTSQAQLDAARLAMAQGKKVKVRVKHAHGHVSTKSTPKKAQVLRKAKPAAVKKTPKVARAASHRFVQVGTFGNPTNAQNAIRRLQSMGLPVKVGKVTRKGRNLQIILAGPFRTQNGLNNAMNAARKSGFRDAIFRK